MDAMLFDPPIFIDATNATPPRSGAKRATPKPLPVGSIIDKNTDKNRLNDLKIDCIVMEQKRRHTAKLLKDKILQVRTLTDMAYLMSLHDAACDAASKSFKKYHTNAMAYMGTALDLALNDDILDKALARDMMKEFWKVDEKDARDFNFK